MFIFLCSLFGYHRNLPVLTRSFPTRRSSDLVPALRREAILFDQVENGDATLLLDIGIAPDDRALVELDRDDALLVAVGFGHDGAACKGARAKGKGERRVPIPSARSCRYFPQPRSFPHSSQPVHVERSRDTHRLHPLLMGSRVRSEE